MGRLSYVMVVWFLGIAHLQAQDDSTRYIFGLPVSEDDTTEQFSGSVQDTRRNLIPLAEQALPRKVLKALSNERQYDGWRDSTVYLDKDTGLFIVPVKTSDGTKIFGLNKDGNAVTFDEVDPAPD